MKLHHAFIAGLLACVSDAAVAGLPSEPLVEPLPVGIPVGMAPAVVAKAVKRSLAGRNWMVTREESGYLEGTLMVRNHMLKVGVTYDDRLVTMKYVESTGLGYRERAGRPRIHPKYMHWTRNVMTDLNRMLQDVDLADPDAR